LFCKQISLLAYSNAPKEKEKNHFILDLDTLNASGEVKYHMTHDVAIVRIGQVLEPGGKKRASFLPGVKVMEYAPSGILGVGSDTIKKIDEVLTANEIYVFGYPTSIGIRENPQIDYQKPLIRKGIVAGTNEQ
jgi:hypothetical protein